MVEFMKNIKKIVRERYGEIAQQGESCCGGNSCCCGTGVDNSSKIIGYSDEQLNDVPKGANLGLGCGNPLAIASMKKGDVVLDLGSGAGIDAFLASRKVGDKGRVIGVDMTDEMIEKARRNAKKGNYFNVEFRKGDIENLPVENESVDLIISNCVINLAPDKKKVFKEAYRVLKQGGKIVISDIVLTRQLPKKMREDKKLLTGCVGGAIIKQDYLNLLSAAGFSDIKIHKETPFLLDGYGLSITFSAIKK
ncbi:MAG: arsenite methyltransferase [Candidatus Omnitrophica bacterium]|nr:arsenite methyltransferase [Candidatus Omnitrophota bacterium]